MLYLVKQCAFSLSTDEWPLSWVSSHQEHIASAKPGSGAAASTAPEPCQGPLTCPPVRTAAWSTQGSYSPQRMELPSAMLCAPSFCCFPQIWPRFQGRHLCNRFLISCNHGEMFFLITPAGYTAKYALNLTQLQSLDTVICVCFLL